MPGRRGANVEVGPITIARLAACALLLGSSSLGAAAAKIVAHDVTITVDQVGPGQPGIKIGDVHGARIFFDDGNIDAATRRTPMLHMQHGHTFPAHLDPAQMPMGNSYVDLSGLGIKFYYAAAPFVPRGEPYYVVFDDKTRRMSTRKLDGTLMLSGPYAVDPHEFSGSEIDAVVQPEPAAPPAVRR